MKKIALALSLCFLIGCTRYTDPSVVAQNKATLAGKGEYIGTLPDGREVRRYFISMGDSHDHWIYVTDGSITVNHAVSSGKTTVNHVNVIIDGVLYKPAEKE